MKKSTIRALVVLGIIFVAYQVLAFVLPFPKTAVFWVSYVFTDIALLSQIYVFRSAFRGTETVKSKFYGFPIAEIGVVYAAAQLVLGFLFMALGNILPVWAAVLVYVLMFVAAAVGTISSEAMRDEIEHQDEKLKVDVSCMRKLQSLTATMAAQSKEKSYGKEVSKLAEDIRFSDPVSSEATAESENELSVCIEELQKALLEDQAEDIAKLCAQAELILSERNRICKLAK